MPETEQSEEGSVAETVTVKVWTGGRRESYESVTESDPEEYELPVVPTDTYYVPHDDHVLLAEDIDNHAKYGFLVETDQPVELIVETNDSYHAPVDGFTDGSPVERGLRFTPESVAEGSEPFLCELWGRIRMRVEAVDD